MTGPEHYREAERLLNPANSDRRDLAAAQTHATLALAAAYALHDAIGSAGYRNHLAWREAAGYGEGAA